MEGEGEPMALFYIEEVIAVVPNTYTCCTSA